MPLPKRTCSSLIRLHREIPLPVPGKILVRKGQWVEPGDVVAQAPVGPRHITLDISRSLGLPAEEIDDYFQFRVGDSVTGQDILAGPVGYAQRVVRAPSAGKIVRIANGKLTLQIAGQPQDIKTELPGVVVDLIADQGIMIEMTGALIQGVWGNGRTYFGKYLFLDSREDSELKINTTDSPLKGIIVVGGMCDRPEKLKLAQEIGVGGLVISGLAANLYESAARALFPILVLEGFGQYPLSPQAYQILAMHSGKVMGLNARPWDWYSGKRPEAVIPLEPEEAPLATNQLGVIQPGQSVRVISPPVFGMRGTLVDIPGIRKFSNGVLGLSATILLENGSESIFPLANLEFID